MSSLPIVSDHVAVAVLRSQPGGTEVLLLQRSLPPVQDAWCWVAGRVQEHESAWRAALRELGEETTLTPRAFYSADICEQYYDSERECISIVPVFVAFVTAEQKVVINREHRDFRWLTLEAAEKCVPFASQGEILQRIGRQFVDRSPSKWLRIDDGESTAPRA